MVAGASAFPAGRANGKTDGMLVRPFVVLSLAAALTSCGGDSAPTLTVDAACRAAAAAFAESPGPGATEAEQTAFLDVAQQAVEAAAFPIRDRAGAGDGWALKELARLLDSFPRLAGFWSIEEIAWLSRATVVRIDEVATELGEPACGAATFRLADWEALTDTLTPPAADDATYLQGLGDLCAETIGAFSLSSTTGSVGAAMNWTGAQRALSDFRLHVGELVPSAALADAHLELLVAAQSVDALLPDVATTIDGERLTRIQAALERMGAALAASGVTC